MSETNQEFGKWRSFLWPIHAYELKKVLPMFFMFFFISFNYTILRDTKDTLIVTAAGSGAEAIPFLKVWGVLPSAMIFMLLYARLSNSLTKPQLFYTALTPFIIFFALFSTVIYPNRELLHPTTSADWLQAALPSGFYGLIAIYRNWTYSLFYILSELWGSVGISLLFWGFANDITRVSEAKRFYSIFGLGANLALLFSGPTIIKISSIRGYIEQNYPGTDPWGVSLNGLMAAVVVAGIITLALYYYMTNVVLTDPRFENKDPKKKKSKPKLSMMDSIKFLGQSRYIALLTILVISYGIIINIYEVTWKSQIKLVYDNPNDYSAFMGYYSTCMGLFSSFMMLFVGGNFIRRLGWKAAALFTPLILVATGSLFFIFIIFKNDLNHYIAALGTTPIFLAVIIGTIQNILSKASKYSLFDPTKEMAYIPLDEESKVKGKAAIDVVGARLGKSGGSLVQQGLFMLLGTGLAGITPHLFVISLIIGAAWILAVNGLSIEFNKVSSAGNPEGSSSKKAPAASPAS